MAQAVNGRTALVYVCNPDTPSGTMRTPAEIEAFCREVAPQVPVVLDEVYLDLLDDFVEQTQVKLIREGLPVLICRSFSKLHALAGHRIGYLIGPPSILRRLEPHRMSGLKLSGCGLRTGEPPRYRLPPVQPAQYSRWSHGPGRTPQ